MREQKGWDLLQASCRQPSFSIYLQTRTVRSPSACQDTHTHTYCTPLVLSISFLVSLRSWSSFCLNWILRFVSLPHIAHLCVYLRKCVCLCEWLFLKVFLIRILQKRGHLIRDKRNWTLFFFFISSLILWVISSLSLTLSSSLWCSQDCIWQRSVCSCPAPQFFLIVTQRTFFIPHNEKRRNILG